ncbi:MAG: ABC transporter permease [Alphaproteobacteria bacterium]|jgi:putative hydroxymethylpyrimidine transport system permease protein|nr:ABC transporter permease [Anaerolineaceae bacterium]MDP6013301.1 ABC transporter permease [Alphaproteobacteria bacterium]MDP6239010.1 ABC transporter permease [Alphaproteobacteria bacterium]MDP7234126.1 ABC transporter permease [Alphaproteobacteria bacterium]HJN22291.1 ABC transporter permease [Alphaproteobacteria bacterium]
MTVLRRLAVALGLLALWQAVVWLAATPPYILPGPNLALLALIEHRILIIEHAAITLLEIVLGMIIGTACGAASALALARFGTARAWLLPVLVVSQALPVFALAPLLVLWLGYGLGSKVAMAVLIIYFPVTATFYDGLRRTDTDWLNLATTMGASPLTILFRIRLPAALPALASGMRVAASVAPIGAIVGEWVGSSAGLGYLMLHANGRMQIDLVFAALLVLAVIAVALYSTVDRGMRALMPWQSETVS